MPRRRKSSGGVDASTVKEKKSKGFPIPIINEIKDQFVLSFLKTCFYMSYLAYLGPAIMRILVSITDDKINHDILFFLMLTCILFIYFKYLNFGSTVDPSKLIFLYIKGYMTLYVTLMRVCSSLLGCIVVAEVSRRIPMLSSVSFFKWHHHSFTDSIFMCFIVELIASFFVQCACATGSILVACATGSIYYAPLYQDTLLFNIYLYH
eukprot:GHVR01102087.1.p1 GENE.GHVR01102087.1~~GHVR01102087.1.p1  ORF type:complete len:207 (+),score=9.44 GHVR01102087.1:99-719(+)